MTENKTPTKIIDLFNDLLEIAPEEREAQLEKHLTENPQMYAQLKTMLDSADNRPAAFLEQSPLDELANSRIGSTLNNYQLIEKLGHGGMADVYLAKRIDGVHEQQVAIKIIRGIGDCSELVARFERERRILSSLQSPYIATLLDGGTTPEGLPYYVMEYIDGPTIDIYCQQEELSLRERLHLFLKVCGAISYAHRHLVVHRDIKPSNILINSQGEPKLLDFGIAKVIDEERNSQDQQTVIGTLPMTLQYASPEQLRGEVLTTATDIYSLGILFYELICGHHPHADLDKQALIDTLKNLATPLMSKTAAKVGNHNAKALKGDLDAIANKALQTLPQDRYQSVLAFADDIDAYLQHKPINARKVSNLQRGLRLVQRNKTISAVVGTAVVLIITITATQQLRVLNERDTANQQRIVAEAERDNAQRERDRSRETEAFLVDLFETSDPSNSKGEAITARELLDRGIEKISNELTDQPETKSSLLHTLGTVSRKLGLYQEAESQLKEALILRQQIYGEENLETAATLNQYGVVLSYLNKFDIAKEMLVTSIAIHDKLLGEGDLASAEIRTNLGWVFVDLGEYDQARNQYNISLNIWNQREPPNLEGIAENYTGLSAICYHEGNLNDAIWYAEQALEKYVDALGPEDADVGNAHYNIALYKSNNGDIVGAITALKKAIEIKSITLGPIHPDQISLYDQLGLAYARKGEFESAISHHQLALEIAEKKFGSNHLELAPLLDNFGTTYNLAKNYIKSVEYHTKALNIATQYLGENHPNIAYVLLGLGDSYEKLNDNNQALLSYQRAYEINLATHGEESPNTQLTKNKIQELEK